jgi:hypothetical protein
MAVETAPDIAPPACAEAEADSEEDAEGDDKLGTGGSRAAAAQAARAMGKTKKR